MCAGDGRRREWDVRLTPYLWVAGVDGDIHVRGRDFSASADFSDILDKLETGGALMFEANKGNWVNFAQVDYLALDSGEVELGNSPLSVDLQMDSTLAAVATGYRFHAGERSTIDVMVGLRYANIETTLDVDGLGHVNSDVSQYDGMLMLRPRFRISGYWYFSPTMSVGAGDSDLVWEMAPEVVYEYCDTEFRIGYRSLNYDLEKGNDSLDFSMRGPVIGVGFKF